MDLEARIARLEEEIFLLNAKNNSIAWALGSMTAWDSKKFQERYNEAVEYHGKVRGMKDLTEDPPK